MERAGKPRQGSQNPKGEDERAGSERVNAFGDYSRIVAIRYVFVIELSFGIQHFWPKVGTMKTKLFLAAVVSAGLAFSMVAQANENKSEVVDVKTLPAAVQKTITEKAGGGKLIRVQREDDKNGKWNYEVVIDTGGKEWGFEVDPNGKYLKKRADQAKAQ
jgi:hypothetical protein